MERPLPGDIGMPSLDSKDSSSSDTREARLACPCDLNEEFARGVSGEESSKPGISPSHMPCPPLAGAEAGRLLSNDALLPFRVPTGFTPLMGWPAARGDNQDSISMVAAWGDPFTELCPANF